MSTDSDIQMAVSKELAADPQIDADDIVVDIVYGAVSLTGTVPSQAQCAEATAAARRVAGATRVDNLLAVALPSRDFGDDVALAQFTNQALAETAAVPDGVKATVREGSVTLTGTVSISAQRVAAEDTVAGVAGVVNITNEIEVQSDT